MSPDAFRKAPGLPARRQRGMRVPTKNEWDRRPAKVRRDHPVGSVRPDPPMDRRPAHICSGYPRLRPAPARSSSRQVPCPARCRVACHPGALSAVRSAEVREPRLENVSNRPAGSRRLPDIVCVVRSSVEWTPPIARSSRLGVTPRSAEIMPISENPESQIAKPKSEPETVLDFAWDLGFGIWDLGFANAPQIDHRIRRHPIQ